MLSRRSVLAFAAFSAIAAVPTQASAEGAYIAVPTYVQQRNLSCEYAALTIATAAFGAWISEYEFDERVGQSANPHWGFRGDINGWWGNTTDYGVYPEALVGPLAELGFSSDVHYAQGDASVITTHLDAGTPMLVWLSLWGDLSFYEYAEDGTPFKLTPGYHVVVVNGYDDTGVSYSDPAKGTYGFYDWDTFMWMWNVLDGMALGVAPM
ncbi:MAG: C39 family peptidase [Chloroflexia bacterium]|nr:C39 family peptidase [Chloroflexia bacterium]